jgi:hypothetical protein
VLENGDWLIQRSECACPPFSANENQTTLLNSQIRLARFLDSTYHAPSHGIGEMANVRKICENHENTQF